MVECLLSLYKKHDFLRESLQKLFVKLVNQTPTNVSTRLLEKLASQLLQTSNLKDFLFEHNDNLALYFCLKPLFDKRRKETSKKTLQQVSFDFFEDFSENLQNFSKIIGKSTYLLPRLHSSVPLLVNAAFESADSLTSVTEIIRLLLDGYLFNEQVYLSLKSTARPKCLHIGLNLWNFICEKACTVSEDAFKEKILKELLSMNFCIIFVRKL